MKASTLAKLVREIERLHRYHLPQVSMVKVGAFMIRIGFWGSLLYDYNNNGLEFWVLGLGFRV